MDVSSSEISNHTETAHPVQETGSNCSQTLADYEKTLGKNRFITTGNQFGLSIDIRQVSVWNASL